MHIDWGKTPSVTLGQEAHAQSSYNQMAKYAIFSFAAPSTQYSNSWVSGIIRHRKLALKDSIAL